MPFVGPSKCLGAPGDQRGEQGFHTRYPLMRWSGRAPARQQREAGKGRQRQGACHVLQAHYGIAVLAGLRRQAAIAKCKAMGRSDPYQERAREMAREAGLDPDDRIERPGQRSMPVWCTFRDAARKEHLALEAADAANTIATEKPQAPQFQNSPLKVSGEHDHATVAQMRNCMSVGNVVTGVVCADGHLGYAQPVGGVIAYEKQISISGVGFDIGCGNMAIRLDTPFSAVEALAQSSRTCPARFRLASGAPTKSRSTTSSSTMPRPGLHRTWNHIVRRRRRSLAPSGLGITTSISCATRMVSS